MGSSTGPSAAQNHLRVESLHRYPVKSMLGESVDVLFVDDQGAEGDRRLALIDATTGRVASAKQARLWRDLLKCSATIEGDRVHIRLPDGTTAVADQDGIDEILSRLLARPVRLLDSRPDGATLERADPDQVLERGLDAEVDAPLLELAQATPGDSFVDLAPLHAITTATLAQIGTEAQRYRPNLVITTPPGYPAYAENEWTGRTLMVGGVQVTALGPTPRCVIPTLEHGRLARAPHALRTPVTENRVQAFDFGVLPCAGTYLAVKVEGAIRTGEQVSLG
ncbi:molybdenum cofactor biosysynthesis protein (plasmid) [Mycolicibacterium arabiense]|uniref:Molybdenum cofactor biosysynthesis protein n=1 Tax=Mycolicibacterium arabiense TaxID=1286181 RepID=A0A7I7RQG1_9MYCO|nr:MOSC N-terminal beta barrel domain-containing protein [Mycolicibacterium arabiense]MCV7376952.1 MOSC N-terminal beta barrel domain-containing protein [Mycolicibacterium arabiense]BBY46763.1 molybdenum cofactor biosysynthesis protein [Mycolicibacterium arabiense]